MQNFVDQVELVLKSGDGGAGSSSFRREKYIPKGGPDGGDGGRGGDVIVKTSIHDRTLRKLRYRKEYSAENGHAGVARKKHGKDGKDLIIEVPLGTVVKDAVTGHVIADLDKDNISCKLLEGGLGGRGNVHFKSATRQAPTYAQPGIKGVERQFIFELELHSDISFVGMPNVGKSSLLKVLTNANPKIANYPFTTLIPNLGTLVINNKEIVLSDIPGIVGDASEGKGLGLHFLRHIRRTQVLAYVLDAGVRSIEDIFSQYKMLHREVIQYYQKYYDSVGEGVDNKQLLEKKKFIIISRLDITEIPLSYEQIKTEIATYLQNNYSNENLQYICTSAHSLYNINELKELLYNVINL